MSTFDDVHKGRNKYAKSNSKYLKSMFGREDLAPFWLADMDFKVATPIIDEIRRLADRGNFSYEFNSRDVYESISNWNKQRNSLHLDPGHFIQVPGVLSGMALMVRELTAAGDSILIQTPVYHQFFQLIKSANRNVVENPLKVENGRYCMDFEGLEEKLSAGKAKVMLLCNPHNPVGRVWALEELEKLVEVANRYGVTIISDEIHSDVVFNPHTFNSIAAVDKEERHVAVLGSPAKTFGMHSIANGYVYISNHALFKQVKSVVASMYLGHGNAISSYATIAAYNNSEAWLDELISYLEATVNWVEGFVRKEIPLLHMHKPEGTYQIWLDFSDLELEPQILHHLLVNKARLALTPGTWFGGGHAQYMRINIAAPRSVVQQAFFELKEALNEVVEPSETKPRSNMPCCG